MDSSVIVASLQGGDGLVRYSGKSVRSGRIRPYGGKSGRSGWTRLFESFLKVFLHCNYRYIISEISFDHSCSLFFVVFRHFGCL